MSNRQPPTDPRWTILDTLQWTTGYFSSNHIDSPRLTAEILLAHSLGIERIDLYMRFDQPLSKQELARFKSLIKRRNRREPVAYITGEKEFMGLGFRVSRHVLIPRPETEFLVEKALDLIPAVGSRDFCGPKRIMDLGTGSGAVVVALAVNRPGHLFYASDISFNALHLARANAEKNRAAGIFFSAADRFAPLDRLKGRFDMILSNPPYIPTDEIDRLEPEISRYEPRHALDGGADGLDIIRYIIENATFYLNRNGVLMLEIGFNQAESVERIVKQTGCYAGVDFIRDYAGHDRVLVAQTERFL